LVGAQVAAVRAARLRRQRRAREEPFDLLPVGHAERFAAPLGSPPMDPRFSRLAELAVSVGANVQPGQIVGVTAQIGEEEPARALAESAYRRGAKFVDVWFFDPWVKRARIEHAPEDTLDFVPGWYGQRLLALGEERSAR